MQRCTFAQVSYFVFFMISAIMSQGSHKLEKYLNLEGFLEKSLKIKYALKVLENHAKALNSSISVGLVSILTPTLN